MQEMAYGTPLIENEIRKSVGLPLKKFVDHEINGSWCAMIIHNRKGQEGVFERLDLEPDFARQHAVVTDLSVTPGDYVHRHTGSNCSLGDMLIRYDTRDQLDAALSRIHELVRIVLKQKE